MHTAAAPRPSYWFAASSTKVLPSSSVSRAIVSAPMGMGARPNRFGVDLPGRFLNHRTARKELAAIGQAGVETVLEILRRELQTIMRQAGTTSIGNITRANVVEHFH